jgi:hypothetical protein
MKKIETRNFSKESCGLGISAASYRLLNQKKVALNAQGFKTTYRELADKAIIAAYSEFKDTPQEASND